MNEDFAAVRQAAAKECKDLLARAERHGVVAPLEDLVLLLIKRLWLLPKRKKAGRCARLFA